MTRISWPLVLSARQRSRRPAGGQSASISASSIFAAGSTTEVDVVGRRRRASRTSASSASSAARRRARSLRSPSARAWTRQRIRRIRYCLVPAAGRFPDELFVDPSQLPDGHPLEPRAVRKASPTGTCVSSDSWCVHPGQEPTSATPAVRETHRASIPRQPQGPMGEIRRDSAKEVARRLAKPNDATSELSWRSA
jgi:hypothetical protein